MTSFEELVAGGWPAVEALVTDREPETLHLEFKSKGLGGAEYNDNDRAVVARALSGFANVAGGLLVVGVAARGDRGEPDRVTGLSAIADARRFQGALERSLRAIVDPPIAGVRLDSVVRPAGTDGVVLVEVPASDGGPHRTTNVAREVTERYYMRTATMTEVMPHALLADRFGRRPPPRLRLHARFPKDDGVGLNLELLNEGRGVAERPAILFRGIDTVGLGWRQLTDLARGWTILYPKGVGRVSEVVYQSEVGTLVYPGLPLPVAHLSVREGGLGRIEVTGTLFCVGSQPVPFALEVWLGGSVVVP